MRKITPPDVPDRPLRKDAERNRRRILDAARELFAQRGLDASLNDVAHHAGVGVGTVYRRFRDKTALIDSLFDEDFEEIAARLEEAVEDPDAWRGLMTALTRTAEEQFADKGLKELLTETPEGMARIARLRDRLQPLTTELVSRAQASGQMRDDIHATDFPLVQLMVGAVTDAAHGASPDLWRRYMALLLRGMAADPSAMELPVEALQPAQLDRVLSRYKSPRR